MNGIEKGEKQGSC